jgi:hypothetical protein
MLNHAAWVNHKRWEADHPRGTSASEPALDTTVVDVEEERVNNMTPEEMTQYMRSFASDGVFFSQV